MTKLLMTWDIRAGRETPYLEFVGQEFMPALLRLGLEPTEVWYTYWGDGPQILMGCVAGDDESLRDALRDAHWHTLRRQLDEYVVNFRYKMTPATGRFQL